MGTLGWVGSVQAIAFPCKLVGIITPAIPQGIYCRGKWKGKHGT